MKISKEITYAAGNLREIKNIQKGAETLIYRHTDLNLSVLDKDIKKKGNEIIRNRFLRYDGDLNDASAALVLLGLLQRYYFLQDEESMADRIGGCILSLRDAVQSLIKAEVSLQVSSVTGF